MFFFSFYTRYMCSSTKPPVERNESPLVNVIAVSSISGDDYSILATFKHSSNIHPVFAYIDLMLFHPRECMA